MSLINLKHSMFHVEQCSIRYIPGAVVEVVGASEKAIKTHIN